MSPNLVAVVLLSVLSAFSCSEGSDMILPQGSRQTGAGPQYGAPPDTAWLIPKNEVFSGGPGKDGIPSIDQPEFTPAGQVSFLGPNDLVLGVRVGDQVKAYPHPILDWHEIVNDRVDGLPLAITYCPLTGTGIGWKRMVNGSETTFGVSGLLYNSNLIPYDRATDSNWSQMLLQSVNGEQKGAEAETFPLVETTWKTWREQFPNSQVLNTNTGFSRNYGRYPYGDYKTNNDFLLFPVSREDDRLASKQRGLGVLIDDSARFYPLSRFSGSGPVVVQETIRGQDLVIVGNTRQNYAVAFQRRLPDGTLLEFSPADGARGRVLQDQEGNTWDLFGHAVEGPRRGEILPPTQSYVGYWFAWATFYPSPGIY